MRVLYISKALVVASYRSKIRCLARDIDIRAVVPDRWPPSGIETLNGDAPWIAPHPVRFAGHPHLHFYSRLGETLDAFRPDLVHVDEEPYSAVTSLALRACHRRHIPAVLFAAQSLYKRLPPPFGALRRYALDHVTAAQAGTPAAADVLRRAGYRGAIATFPQLGVEEERFCRASSPPRGEQVVVGFGGRLVRYKAVDLLIAAVARVPGVVLEITGDGPERSQLETRAQALGLAARVRFVGHRDSLSMPDWLQRLDLLVLPSISTRSIVEQFGRILIEAMSCEVPVIGSSSGGIPGVIGDAGIIVPEGDVAALAAAIQRLTDSPAERSRLGRAGRARVLERFTQQRIADQTLAWYQEVLR